MMPAEILLKSPLAVAAVVDGDEARTEEALDAEAAAAAPDEAVLAEAPCLAVKLGVPKLIISLSIKFYFYFNLLYQKTDALSLIFWQLTFLTHLCFIRADFVL